MKEFNWLEIYDIILKTYPCIPHLFKCEIFHLRPEGGATAQTVIEGNLSVWLECLMSTLVTSG